MSRARFTVSPGKVAPGLSAQSSSWIALHSDAEPMVRRPGPRRSSVVRNDGRRTPCAGGHLLRIAADA